MNIIPCSVQDRCPTKLASAESQRLVICLPDPNSVDAAAVGADKDRFEELFDAHILKQQVRRDVLVQSSALMLCKIIP